MPPRMSPQVSIDTHRVKTIEFDCIRSDNESPSRWREVRFMDDKDNVLLNVTAFGTDVGLNIALRSPDLPRSVAFEGPAAEPPPHCYNATDNEYADEQNALQNCPGCDSEHGLHYHMGGLWHPDCWEKFQEEYNREVGHF